MYVQKVLMFIAGLTVWLLGQSLNGKSRLCMTIRAGRRGVGVGASELNYGDL